MTGGVPTVRAAAQHLIDCWEGISEYTKRDHLNDVFKQAMRELQEAVENEDQRQRFKIAWYDHATKSYTMKPIAGYVVGSFGITKGKRSWETWTVYHLGSGFSVNMGDTGFKTLKGARAYAQEIEGILDWSKVSRDAPKEWVTDEQRKALRAAMDRHRYTR